MILDNKGIYRSNTKTPVFISNGPKMYDITQTLQTDCNVGPGLYSG
jgi:hypothetical protein